MTLHQVNRPDYFAHLGAILSTPCPNASTEVMDRVDMWTQHVIRSMRGVIGEMRDQLGTVNDCFAPENLRPPLDPESHAGRALDALHPYRGVVDDGSFSQARDVLRAAEIALDGIARGIGHPVIGDDEHRQEVFDELEAADYYHSNTPDLGARYAAYPNDDD